MTGLIETSMKKTIVLLLCILPLLTIPSCDFNSGLQPTRSGFRGKIYFQNSWPPQTDQVIVVAATKFPPTSITEIVMGDPLPLFQDSTTYELYTPPQSFAAIGVVWKQKNQPWDVTNIIGIYFDSDDHFTPGKITLSNRDQMLENMDLVADLSKAKLQVSSGIEGMLHIKGAWPVAAQSILMAASKPILPSSLLDISLGQPMAVPFDSTRFFINLQPGTYRLIGALLIEQGVDLSISSLAGIYYKKAGDLFPGSITIPNDTTRVRGMHITIDFNKKPFPG
jgi:hypothetical protein